MLSSENARILKWVKNHDRCFFSDDDSIPDWITEVRLDHLVNLGFLHYTCDSSGIGFYQLLPAGEDALSEKQRADDEVRNQAAQYEEEKRAHIRERKQDFVRDFVFLIIGALLTVIVEFLFFH